jgi:hypothetical protein
MRTEELEDFIAQMRVLAYEEAPSWEIEVGSRDLMPGGGGYVDHGPWFREDCAAVLATWADAGLISISRYERWPRSYVGQAAPDDACAVLAASSSWPSVDDPTWWELVATDHGRTVEYATWRSLLAL